MMKIKMVIRRPPRHPCLQDRVEESDQMDQLEWKETLEFPDRYFVVTKELVLCNVEIYFKVY